jgi:hypothetical protein
MPGASVIRAHAATRRGTAVVLGWLMPNRTPQLVAKYAALYGESRGFDTITIPTSFNQGSFPGAATKAAHSVLEQTHDGPVVIHVLSGAALLVALHLLKAQPEVPLRGTVLDSCPATFDPVQFGRGMASISPSDGERF